MISSTTVLFSKNSLMGFFFFIFLGVSAQQQKIISGTVSDNSNIPIPGVNIIEENNPRNGVVSDFDGDFSIAISPGSRLSFSYVGIS